MKVVILAGYKSVFCLIVLTYLIYRVSAYRTEVFGEGIVNGFVYYCQSYVWASTFKFSIISDMHFFA